MRCIRGTDDWKVAQTWIFLHDFTCIWDLLRRRHRCRASACLWSCRNISHSVSWGLCRKIVMGKSCLEVRLGFELHEWAGEVIRDLASYRMDSRRSRDTKNRWATWGEKVIKGDQILDERLEDWGKSQLEALQAFAFEIPRGLKVYLRLLSGGGRSRLRISQVSPTIWCDICGGKFRL